MVNLTNEIKNICVYSSSGNELENKYYAIARELGVLMANAGFNLVYGGGTLGAMWANASAVKEFGGEIIGVLPEKLYQIGVGDANYDKLIITKCMRSRKEKMDELSDAFIALAGGFGTLEELSEMIVQKQLGYTDKAIVILNTDGFYDNLLKFFGELFDKKFAHHETKEFCFVAQTPKDAIEYLKSYQPKYFDIKQKLNIK